MASEKGGGTLTRWAPLGNTVCKRHPQVLLLENINYSARRNTSTAHLRYQTPTSCGLLPASSTGKPSLAARYVPSRRVSLEAGRLGAKPARQARCQAAPKSSSGVCQRRRCASVRKDRREKGARAHRGNSSCSRTPRAQAALPVGLVSLSRTCQGPRAPSRLQRGGA